MNLLNLLCRVSLKHIRYQKMRTMIAIFGIALGVSAMTAIDIVNTSVIRSLEDTINRISGRALLQVTGAESGFPESMLERIQKVQGVEYAVPVIETNANLATGDERSFVILGIDVLQDNNIRDYSVKEESSDIPDPLLFLAKPDSILLTKEMALREGIKIDQKIQVQTVQGLKTFTVRGLLEPDGPAKALGGDIAVMDIYAAQMAFGKDKRIDRIDISIVRGETLDSMKARIHAVLPASYNIDTPAGRSRQIQNLMAGFNAGMAVVSFMALLVGMYLIYNTVSISVVQRRKEIGILRALGATRGQISRLFLAETVMISLLASFLGIGLGLLFAKLSIGAVTHNLSFMYGRSQVSELVFSWVSMVKNIGIGILASVIAASFPARSSASVTPVSAIRALPYNADGVLLGRTIKIVSICFIILTGLILLIYKTAGPASPIRNAATATAADIFLLIGISLATPVFLQWFIKAYHAIFSTRLGAAGRLAGLNLEKNLSRNAVAVAAVVFSISLAVSSACTINSFRSAFLDYIDANDRSDIIITSGSPLASAGAQTIPMPLSMATEIEAVPGVAQADPFRKVFLNISGKRVPMFAIDINCWRQHNTCTVISGSINDIKRLMPNQDAVAINETTASQMGLKPGDTIVLPTPGGPKGFLVAAVIVSYQSDAGVITMDLQTYERHWNDHVADMFSVYVKPGSDVAMVRKAIQESFQTKRKMYVLSALEFRNEIKKMLDGMFVMIDAVNMLTLLIAGFGIIVTLLASVLERTREIGILRAIGMKRIQVSVMVIIESSLIGAVGGILGVFVGVINGWINLEGFIRLAIGASVAYHIPYGSIIGAMLLAIGLSVLAGLYPSKRAAQTNITEALSYE